MTDDAPSAPGRDRPWATTAPPACCSGGGWIAEDDRRTESYGTIDEAVAALGLARAQLGLKAQDGVLSPSFGGLADLILRLQARGGEWPSSVAGGLREARRPDQA